MTQLAEISPLAYQIHLRDYLKQTEPDLWDWFATGKVQEDHADDVRLELLKSTYRLERESEPRLAEVVDQVVAKLGITGQITLYQSQHPVGLNASLAYLPGEAHIILHGPLASKLTDSELLALFGHELAHYLLWENWDGEFLIVNQLLNALANDGAADTACMESARLFRLYTEIFCDRVSTMVSDDHLSAVSLLVKVHTELENVNPENYLQQANEVLAKYDAASESESHPETYIRAQAIRLFHEDSPLVDDEIRRMIEGHLILDRLDLLGQQRAINLTRQLLDRMLRHPWWQTKPVLAHSKLYFSDYQPPPADLISSQDIAVDQFFDSMLSADGASEPASTDHEAAATSPPQDETEQVQSTDQDSDQEAEDQQAPTDQTDESTPDGNASEEQTATTEPEQSEPDTADSEPTDSETAEPEPVESEVAEPETTEQETTEPDKTKSEPVEQKTSADNNSATSEGWSLITLNSETLTHVDDNFRRYLQYVMLDFITADRDLEEYPIAVTLSLAEELGMKDDFFELVRKELRLRKKQLQNIDKQKHELVRTINERSNPS